MNKAILSLIPWRVSVGACLLALVCSLCGCGPNPVYTDNRILMGTFVEVISHDKRASEIVFLEIKRIEDLLSKYSPQSEISRLNNTGSLTASPETFFILKKSKEFFRISGGAFDITIGPLMDIWGFTGHQYKEPEKEKIIRALGLIGSDKIVLRESDNMVKFENLGIKIDLGAIAKGYAVDCAIKKLKDTGIHHCLINAGGQIGCLGDNAGKPWKIAIKDPREKGFIECVEVKNRSVSTSGDYEQFFVIGNKRYSHIFDPRTGYPADSGIISVTVIADDGLTADALSTSIFILGKKKGMELAAEFPEVEVKIIEDRNVQDNP